MDKLIPMMMKLQDAFNVINVRNQIELPQIVVVGAQSTGKSSVLESIVGRDFLPRGQGIVTRCPLVLQLRRTDPREIIKPKGVNLYNFSDDRTGQEYGEFLHRKGEYFTDFAKIRREIEDQTSRIAGNDKNISDEPISLTIYSPYVVDLTLVDLPGITKVPIKGQPYDIEDQIKRITYKFITQKNSLVLALTAANTDLANSDALKMAREVDPDGERTIGVVTKIDLMDQGTDALELLQGKIYPLKLGYYGIKCRSQKQIDQNVSIKEAIASERDFFQGHPIYSQHTEKLGVNYLSESLNKILCTHIVKCIPSLSRQINELLSQKEMELLQLDMNSYSVQGDKGPIVLNLINRFTTNYGEMIEGKFVKDSAVDCIGGSRINYIFHSIFVKSIKDVDPFQYLNETDIQTAIRNAQALSPSLFVPEQAFEVLIRQQIARLLEPSLECAQKVYKELRDIVAKVEMQEINRFQRLKYKISDVMETVLDKCLSPTTEMIIQLIEIENAHINTNHPDFVSSADLMLNLFQSDRAEQEEGQVSEQPKPISLLNKGSPDQKGPQINQSQKPQSKEEQKKINVYQQPPAPTKSQQPPSRPTQSMRNEEEEKHQQYQEQQKQGWFTGLFGGSGNQSVPQHKEQKNQLAVSEVVDNQSFEDMDNKRKQIGYPQRNYDEFEILQRFGADQSSLQDKSNSPPVILPAIPSKMRASSSQENSRIIMETIIIQNLIQSYFDIVKKNIADIVPKTIMAFLVNESKNIAQRELVSEIYKQGNLEELMVEDPLVTQTREQRKKETKALKNGSITSQ